jgi:phospholipase D1/2
LIKILDRHQRKKKFKVIIMMPLLPGFVGEIDGDAPVLKVQMHWQY